MFTKKLLFVVIWVIPFQILYAESGIPDYFHANYTLYSNDMKIGKMKRELTKQKDNRYIFSSESKTTGFFSLIRNDHIVERSEWAMNQNLFKPQTYSYEHTGGKKDRFVTINFDWINHKIENIVNDSKWKMDTKDGILDKLLYQITIMHDLKRGIVPEQYTIADGGKIKTYSFKYLQDEVVETPFGKFKAMKIERKKENNDRKTWLWCAYDLEFLPVKVVITEKKDRLTTAILKDVRFEPEVAAK